ncbi:helix-turn-helix transcriptional regulator [Arthrobacter sp. MDT3-44]
MDEELMKPDELARFLGTSTANLAQHRYRGTGPRFVKMGGRAVRYRKSDVTQWLDANTHNQTGAA